MSVTFHAYNYPADFQRVGDFLIRHYQPDNRGGNWLQPAWEYMHHHSMLDKSGLGRIGLWQVGDEIVAVVHYEWCLGEVFFQVHPDYAWLKATMLEYAEGNIFGTREDGRRFTRAYVNDFDAELEGLVQARGYRLLPGEERPMSRLVIPAPFPPLDLPPGFQFKSLADENDLRKIDRVLWRGFDHPGESDGDLTRREIMQSGLHFRPDLNIVVEAPGGDYAAYAGAWYEPEKRIAYVEPVATDPDYRRKGLGRAAVLEGVRRCALEGATCAYVGSDQPFYLAIGFELLYTARCWERILD